MTEYVVAGVDRTVPQYLGLLRQLGLVTDGDGVHDVAFGRDEAESLKRVAPDELVGLYADVPVGDGLVVALNGSGNYHHHTYGFCRGIIDRKGRDYTVFHLDKHGDSRPGKGDLDCGNYLARLVRDSEHAEKAIVIGAECMVHDAKWFDTKAMYEGMDVYPYSEAKARFPRVKSTPDVDCAEMARSRPFGRLDVTWRTVEGEGIERIVARALDRTPTEDVYVTVDLDVLSEEYAATDWGNGKMSLDELLDAIHLIKGSKRIIGLDVTGTCSTAEGSRSRTDYAAAAVVNEVMGGPYEREFFKERIRVERAIALTAGEELPS